MGREARESDRARPNEDGPGQAEKWARAYLYFIAYRPGLLR